MSLVLQICKHLGCGKPFDADYNFAYCPEHRGKYWRQKRYKATPKGRVQVKCSTEKRAARNRQRTKVCGDCGEDIKTRSPHCGVCRKERNSIRTQQWYKEHPTARAEARARIYGLTYEGYCKLLEKQGHRCAICRVDFPGRKGTWPIDHDGACCSINYCRLKSPACGKCVRGLLCYNCNCAIGYFRHDIDRMRAAIRYLEAYKERRANESD